MSKLSANVPPEAFKVLQDFMDAGLRHDEAAMKACVSANTLESGHMNAWGGPENVTIDMPEAHMEGKQAVIHARAIAADAPAGAPPIMEMDCLMIQEDGLWKFDLAGTAERMMGSSMEDVSEQMTAALGEALEGLGDAIAEGLDGAFAESSSPQQEESMWGGASLTVEADELLPLASMTPLPKAQTAVSKAVGSQVIVQAAVGDFLRELAGDDSDMMVNWLEDLLGAWGDLLAEVAKQIPLKGRLRAIRVEETSRVEGRMLVCDASDLVYRINASQSEGYFCDAEIMNLLPGVLAGLPQDIDSAAAGSRLLPTDYEYTSLELYRDKVAPRYMRRISELLGRDIAMESDWDSMGDYTDAGRLLMLWGLNRIYGAIALACQDSSRSQRLQSDLTSIRMTLGTDVVTPFATYGSGTLEVGLSFYGGGPSGCYENEITSALPAISTE